MDNQHKMITGYRDLTQEEIDLMNRIKAVGEQVRELLSSMSYGSPDGGEAPPAAADARWFAIARTHLQEGFMALTRSIAKPTSF
jgi:hypothetical protein